MALNKAIIMKVREKTEKKPEIGDFLIELLEYESKSRGWYKKEYIAILEKAYKGVDEDENNSY